MPTIRTRRTKSGELRYEAQVRLAGTPPQVATFRKLADAKRWAQQTEVAIRDRRHFGRSVANRHTADEAIDRYLTEHSAGLSDKERVNRERVLRFWRQRIGYRKLGDVTTDLLSKALADLERSGRAKATINRYAAAMSRVFSLAEKEWEWIEKNPMRSVTRRREPAGRVRFLSDEERDRLLKACRESRTKDLLPLVQLALATGARYGELTGLRWEEVSFERRTITFHRTKNRERRGVPMLDSARMALESLGPKPSGPIFAAKSYRTAWEMAVERSGIEAFRFHDLRHSCASYLAMSGASLLELAEMLGHKSLSMVKRYAHLSHAHLRGVAERMEGKFLTPSVPSDPEASD